MSQLRTERRSLRCITIRSRHRWPRLPQTSSSRWPLVRRPIFTALLPEFCLMPKGADKAGAFTSDTTQGEKSDRYEWWRRSGAGTDLWAGPEEFLKSFRGKLQTDGYSAYESLAKARGDLTLIGCWAHARRGFHEALAETRLAAWFVRQIGQLYVVEKQLRQQKASPPLRQAMRAWQAQPVLTRLRRAMELVRRRTLPQGLLGQAIDYTLKRWSALMQFVEDGTLEIDNNLIENAIRPSALGRKNFLFIGHPEAGERSAVIYTLLGSCRRHGVNPFDYLKDLFIRLPAAKVTQIKEFTPAAWTNAKRKLVAQAA